MENNGYQSTNNKSPQSNSLRDKTLVLMNNKPKGTATTSHADEAGAPSSREVSTGFSYGGVVKGVIIAAACLIIGGALAWFLADRGVFSGNSSSDLAYNPATQTITAGKYSYKFQTVEGGGFKMGNDIDNSYATRNEMPRHAVVLDGFSMGETEVPQWLWVAVMGKDSNPSYFVGANLPVENVSYTQALEFVNQLNKVTHGNFSLPTEAEWEYAALGGKRAISSTLYAGSDDLEEVAWTETNSGRKTHPVKSLMPNSLSLYDMTGNVGEWCLDYFGLYRGGNQSNPTGPNVSQMGERIVRGGSFNDNKATSRVKSRNMLHQSKGQNTVGFRLVSHK